VNNNGSVISRLSRYISTDIWATRLEDLPAPKAFLVRHLKIVIISIREFIQDRCPLRASALTYYSILSIVPFLALVFAISQGFGFRKLVEAKIFEQIPEQEALLRQIVNFAQALLDNTKGGLIAGIGIVFLLWTVIKVLSHIEHSFNDIWHVSKPRTLVRKFTDYLSIVLVGPIILLLSSSVTVFITTRLSDITRKLELERFQISSLFFGLGAISADLHYHAQYPGTLDIRPLWSPGRRNLLSAHTDGIHPLPGRGI
jgi:membrane protein